MFLKLIITVTFFVSSISAGAITPKVVNGTDAAISEFPFMVSIRTVGRQNGHLCGGTILNEWWILSAAHCLQQAAQVYTVQYANTVISPEGTNVVAVAQVIVHEGYSRPNQEIHDIGVLRLAEAINHPEKDFKVRLPVAGSYFSTGTPAVLIGWGMNETEGTYMTNLQRVDLQIYSSYDCARRHGYDMHPTNICGGVDEGGKGQCSGDSGGPLLVNGVQVGFASWSVKPCTIAPYPG